MCGEHCLKEENIFSIQLCFREGFARNLLPENAKGPRSGQLFPSLLQLVLRNLSTNVLSVCRGIVQSHRSESKIGSVLTICCLYVVQCPLRIAIFVDGTKPPTFASYFGWTFHRLCVLSASCSPPSPLKNAGILGKHT